MREKERYSKCAAICLRPISVSIFDWSIFVQKHNLDQLLVENKLHPQNPQAVDKTLEKELQKRCSAAVQQCMEMLTWGGPALDDLLRTLPGG